MNIQFITDSAYPNNWAMRKSTILKAQGHDCETVQDSPDKVYISCVFPRNSAQYIGIGAMYEAQGIEVEYGGTGFNLELDPEVDHVMPDYSLYNATYSMGFCTRGCPRNCHFCVVTQKEGAKVQRVQHIKEFHDPSHDTVMILDSNILWDKEWFMSNTDYILDNDLILWEHGLDVRKVDGEIADRIKELKFHGGKDGKSGSPKFAFDNTPQEKEIVEGMKLLKKHKVTGSFYVYCDSEECIPDAEYRKDVIQLHKHDWHIMTNQDAPQTNRLKDFKRWGSRPAISRGIPFEEYHGKN